MNSCQKCKSLFLDAFYNELNAEEKSSFLAHLKSCPKCNEEFSRLSDTLGTMRKRQRIEPEADFWENYWDKLEPKLTPQISLFSRVKEWLQNVRVNFRFEPAVVYRFAGAAALLLIGIFIGKLYFGQSQVIQQQEFTNAINESESLSAVNVRANRYLERSKVLLLALVNFDPENEDVYALNIPRQKKISRALVQEAEYLKSELAAPDQEQLKALVSDLEMILMQIANFETEYNLQGIEMVKSGVSRKGILLKINLEEMQGFSQQSKINAENTNNISNSQI
ncbi:hypothetical protein B6I21_05395 [candidate division KSB1 bacterium 4572_119]|nr:MAG: hypothetical protein B6I21_05395 [candidate division KSB1 bacterium 4572_119]